MGKTYRRGSDRSFKGKKPNTGKKAKKWENADVSKKKTVRDYLEDENDN